MEYIKATELRQKQYDIWRSNELEEVFTQLEQHIQSSKETTFEYKKELSPISTGVLMSLGYKAVKCFQRYQGKDIFTHTTISW